jgi:ABC-type transporter Mla subunit MlaD
MTDGDLRKKMEFIVEQQAQFTVNIQKLEENLGRLEKAHVEADARMTRIEGAVVTVVDLVGQLARSQERTVTQLAELAAAQKRTDEALAETNDRLNSFINFVERYLSDRQNGQKPQA